MNINKIGILAYIFLVYGSGLNMTAIKSNSGIMPVLDKTANNYFITDIFPTFINNYYFSIGDIFLLISTILFGILIFKYTRKVINKQWGE
jgi:hypothetical protein